MLFFFKNNHFASRILRDKMDEKNFLKNLGKTITKLRKKKKITQLELAYRCDFEQSNINRIEAGRTNPTTLTLLKIAQALEIHPKQLLSFDLPS